MEKHPHPFDEFLKEALKGHQLAPPEDAKKAFLKEASVILPARKSWLRWYYIPVMVILISGTIAFLYFKEESVPGASARSTPAKPGITAIHKSANKTAKLQLNNTSDNTSPEIPVDVIPDNQGAPVSISPVDAGQPVKSIPAATSSWLALDSTALLPGQNTDTTDEAKMSFSDTLSSIFPDIGPEPDKPVRSEPVSYFAAGAYYLPEWMFNTIEGSKYVNNFGFEGIFYRDRISIRTGLGISMSKGITENAITYNEYLGTYNKLDSVTFIFSESNHDFLPNFHMSEEKVWDSNSKLDSSNVIKRYTYLQVPLVLGFDFWQRGRFTAGVRVGTIMSVMLSSKQLSGTYDPGENLVVGIDKLSPDQVSINWQAIGGISASARLVKSVFFEIEPQAKYYYQSIYEKSGNTKKPWSIGFRTAIMYKF